MFSSFHTADDVYSEEEEVRTCVGEKSHVVENRECWSQSFSELTLLVENSF